MKHFRTDETKLKQKLEFRSKRYKLSSTEQGRREMKAVNIRMVAREAGTSISSVSRYLNDAPGVSLSARQKIGEAIRKLDYRFHSPEKQQIAKRLLSSTEFLEACNIVRGLPLKYALPRKLCCIRSIQGLRLFFGLKKRMQWFRKAMS